MNILEDFFGDTILSDKRRKHTMRATNFNDIGMTEETIKQGISVNKIVFFKI